MTITRCCTRCARKALDDSRYCSRHLPKRVRPSSAARGYDHRWRAFRKEFLRTRPKCECCGGEATEVHHLDGQGPKGARGLDPTNCQPLCKGCHAEITARMQPAGWNG